MRGSRLVPWTSKEEWIYVKSCLFAEPGDTRTLQFGVDRVKVWASRGRLPHAVDSTACFVEIALRDDSRDHGLSLNQLRLLYASAFVRFVNGLVDPAQKGSFAVSVAAIAQRLHLPHWFVELRHAGTHEHLPSIQSLRAGTRLALQWLFEHYWSAPVPVSRSILEEEAQEYQAKEQLREAIRAYKGLRKAALKEIKAKRQTPKPGQLVSKRAIRGIVNLAKHNAAASDFLSAILVELGFLVPTGKKKRVRTNDLVLPNELRDLWAPLLCSLALARPDFATSLASTIIDKLSAWNSLPTLQYDPASGILQLESASGKSKAPYSSTSYLATLASWLRHVLLPTSDGDKSAGIALHGLNVDDVMEKCMRHPNPYTLAILPLIVAKDPIVSRCLKPIMTHLSEQRLELAGFVTDRIAADGASTMTDLSEKAMESELTTLYERVKRARACADGFEHEEDDDDSSADNAPCAGDGEDDMDVDDKPSEQQDEQRSWSVVPWDRWKACPIGCLPRWPSAAQGLPLDVEPEGGA